MQAVLTRNENINLSLVDGIGSLIDKLEYADNKLKAEIENKIVNMGASAVKYLTEVLPTLTGVRRGVVAMSLIRIGRDSIDALKDLASNNSACAWIAEYLISEIV